MTAVILYAAKLVFFYHQKSGNMVQKRSKKHYFVK